ncbi:MAG: xanthine dehydrogenase family protein subunit M, partial [Dehalococcoidia bacterium]|nr:xanthine dehydrogenase family protein subunit M [Dehalococcoidia bacterium]
AEEALKGRPLDEASFEEAARLAQEQAEPISDSHASAEYRKRMVSVFVKRALRQAREKVKP